MILQVVGRKNHAMRIIFLHGKSSFFLNSCWECFLLKGVMERSKFCLKHKGFFLGMSKGKNLSISNVNKPFSKHRENKKCAKGLVGAKSSLINCIKFDFTSNYSRIDSNFSKFQAKEQDHTWSIKRNVANTKRTKS